MGHVTFYVFKDYFSTQTDKKKKVIDGIKDKLTTQTMRYLIT